MIYILLQFLDLLVKYYNEKSIADRVGDTCSTYF